MPTRGIMFCSISGRGTVLTATQKRKKYIYFHHEKVNFISLLSFCKVTNTYSMYLFSELQFQVLMIDNNIVICLD